MNCKLNQKKTRCFCSQNDVFCFWFVSNDTFSERFTSNVPFSGYVWILIWISLDTHLDTLGYGFCGFCKAPESNAVLLVFLFSRLLPISQGFTDEETHSIYFDFDIFLECGSRGYINSLLTVRSMGSRRFQDHDSPWGFNNKDQTQAALCRNTPTLAFTGALQNPLYKLCLPMGSKMAKNY